MCYFSSIKVENRDIMKAFSREFPGLEGFKPVYSASAFTFPLMPVISTESPDIISLYQWGLIPFWVKTPEDSEKIKQRTLNARSETIFEKPSFRHSIRSKRCLVIVDGFFEWRHIGKKRYPYYITLKSRTLFTLAGIWDGWTNPETTRTIKTFSVITTEANELMAKVHNSRKRMPLILPEVMEEFWLNPESDDKTLTGIMKPYDTQDMQAIPVANKINLAGFNTTDNTVNEFHLYPELPGLN
jgi:putative SOS response-associated peptidase YedK